MLTWEIKSLLVRVFDRCQDDEGSFELSTV